MTRTDLHRPSVIQPENYIFVACDYFGGGLDAMDFADDRAAFRAHMAKTGGKFAEHHNTGTCHICGARASYVARFYYVPGNEYIMTGMDCAAKMEIDDPLAFASFKKRVRAGLEATAGRNKAQGVLNDKGVGAAWVVYAENQTGREEIVVRDIVSKVVRYGSISDGQVKYLASLLDRISRRPELEAKRGKEWAAAAPAPQTDKRIAFEGVVLAIRKQESEYGPVTKMLVQHESGYKLWGTLPSGLDAKRGDTVAFTARVERSPQDEKFGFFSRPTKARIVAENADDPNWSDCASPSTMNGHRV